jgi:glycosyltransferase involved in cell wall biosynthesis
MVKVQTVLIVGDFASVTGGQAKVAIDSARLLADVGLDVIFFAATGPVDAALSHPRIRTVCLEQDTILDDPQRLRAIRRGIWNTDAASALREETLLHDPATTILHCHGYAKALSPAIGPILTNGQLRSVFTMHEYFLACPNGGFFDYQRNEICTRKPLGGACLTCNCDVRHLTHKIWRVARSIVARGPGQMPGGLKDLIYISETQRAAMEPHIVQDTHLHYVSNPVETRDPPVNAAANSAYVFVGRLNPEKGGLHFALAAAAAGVPAVFVGDGPERAAILAANPDAVITGWVSPSEVQYHLTRARALVFPSLWYEGQPLVPMEALIRSIPVICGNWSAAREEVVHNRNGIIYNAPTVASLTQALRDVATLTDVVSGDLAQRVSGQTHAARLIAVYEAILSRPA